MADVSIVMPFYNEPGLLPTAVHSVLSQPVEDIELLIVNDHPERFDVSFFDTWTADPRVRLLVHDRNRGVAAARNTGLDHATGRWVGFLDSDDYYTAGGLAHQIASARTGGADITHSLHWKRAVGRTDVLRNGRDSSFFADAGVFGDLQSAPRAQFINSSWCSLYRSDFIERTALRFDSAQMNFEDRLFVLQAVTHADSISFTGHAARVYRKRGHSITTKPPSRASALLVLSLLSKCRDLVRAYAAADPAREQTRSREEVLTLCNLLAQPGLLRRIAVAAEQDDTAITGLAGRLLGATMVSEIARADDLLRSSAAFKRARKQVSSLDELDRIQLALVSGDFAQAAELWDRRHGDEAARFVPIRTVPAHERTDTELVLHLGLHKTGTTYLQTAMRSERERLAKSGVLVPEAGVAQPDVSHVRADGFQGHGGLLRPLRRRVPRDEDPWLELNAEIASSGAEQAVISCENLLAPFAANRVNVLRKLANRLRHYRSVRVVAFVRRPDDWIDSLYRERVVQGAVEGRATPGEFALDFGPALLDLPGLFSPLEDALGQRVELLDYDAASAGEGLWSCFWTHLGRRDIAETPPADTGPVYASADAATILAAHCLGRMVSDDDQRRRALRAFFAASPHRRTSQHQVLLGAAERRFLIELFSACRDDAAARGYSPDLEGMLRDLEQNPPTVVQGVERELLDRAIDAATIARTPE